MKRKNFLIAVFTMIIVSANAAESWPVASWPEFMNIPSYENATNEVVTGEGSFLGQIIVCKFAIEKKTSSDGVERIYAIGTETTANLYSTCIGKNIYFNVTIGSECFAVIPNPYGGRVSLEDYYYAYLYRKGKYVPVPNYTHIAGEYFLMLPI